MIRLPLLLLAGILVLQPALLHADTCDGLLFATDYAGAPSAGSREALLHAVNRGEPIRVGWTFDFDDDGEGDLSHWSDAAILSVWEGNVFAQVDAVHTQRPLAGAGIELREAFVEWRGSLGSDGRIEGRYSDGSAFPADLSASIRWCRAVPATPGWVLLYRHDTDGAPVSGSKEALFAAIRAGQPIQVGWGFRAERDGRTVSAEHLVTPVFLAIINGTDVSAQLPEHVAQQSYLDANRALFDDPAVMWRGLMSTRGSFDAVWVNRASGETVRRYPQRAALSWYAPAFADSDTPTLAVPGGVRRDESRADERIPQ